MQSCYLQGNNISSQAEIDKVFADLKINSDDAGRIENWIGVELALKNGEKVFYSAELDDFEHHATKEKWNTSKVEDTLPSVAEGKRVVKL